MEHHAIQLGQEVFHLLFAVQIPEETRICKPRAQHAFIAGNNGSTTIGRCDIRHQRKARRGGSIWLAQREIALIDTHGGAHDFGR